MNIDWGIVADDCIASSVALVVGGVTDSARSAALW